MTRSKTLFFVAFTVAFLSGCATTQGEIDLNNLKDGDLLFRQADIEAKFDEMRSDNTALQAEISQLDTEIEIHNSKIVVAQRVLSQASVNEQVANEEATNLSTDLMQLQNQLAAKQSIIKANLIEIARLDTLILEKNSLSKAQKVAHIKSQIALEDELNKEQQAFEAIKQAIEEKSIEAHSRSKFQPLS